MRCGVLNATDLADELNSSRIYGTFLELPQSEFLLETILHCLPGRSETMSSMYSGDSLRLSADTEPHVPCRTIACALSW